MVRQLRRAEAEIVRLNQVESHLRSCMQSARGFVIYRLVKDPGVAFGSRVVFASPSIRELLLVDDPSDFSSWFRAVHPDDRPSVVTASVSAAPALAPFDQTMRIPQPDGSLRWIRAVSYPVVDEESEVTHYDGLMIDVTDSVEANRRAYESELRLAQIFEHAPVPLFELQLEPTGRSTAPPIEILAANHAAIDFLDAGDTGDSNSIVNRRLPPSLEQLVVGALPALQRGEATEVEWTHRSRDGLTFNGILSMSSHRIAEGARRVLVSLLDITALRRADDAVRLRDRAIEASLNAVVIADASSRIVHVNPAFETITGYSRTEVIGADQRHSLGIDPSDRGYHDVIAGWESLRPVGAVVRSTRKDGAPYWAQIQTTPVDDTEGNTTHVVSIISDVTQTKEFEQELRHQANHDSLTGLPNRNVLTGAITEAVERARNNRHDVIVAFLDLDNFKYVNDALGHDFGDRILVAMARRLENQVGTDDLVVRYGGDEFVLVLSSPRSPDAAEQLLRHVNEVVSQPLAIDDESLRLTCSIGYTSWSRSGAEPARLLRDADAAMHDVKEQSRNEVAAFTGSTGERVRERVSLESKLRRALEDRQTFALYQPILDVASGRIVGCEALARWSDAELGPISPARFVPIAEETGLIVELGRSVLGEACRQAVRWTEAGMRDPHVAVNVSARQFHTGDIVGVVEQALSDSGLSPDRLVLELTESVLMPNASYAQGILVDLRSMGIGLAIDDFGTGHSSLAYLTRFNVDSLKIDRSFIHDADNDESRTIVRAIASLGKTLGLDIVAEGIETVEQLELISEIGCDRYQGFLVSRPVPGDEILTLAGTRGVGRLPSS